MARKKVEKEKDSRDFINALTELCRDKGISESVIIDALEAALIASYKKNFASAPNVDVKIEPDGSIKVYSKKEVVEMIEFDNPQLQVSIDDARRENPNYEIGDYIYVEETPEKFGRIAAMTAKQVVTQKIREAERESMYSEYNEKKDEIVTGEITRIDEHGNVYVDIGTLEARMPVSEQVSTESYEVHQMIKCYVGETKTVTKTGVRTTQPALKRTNPGLDRKLFEQEVPEIADGTVEIKAISREPGSRTKIAVYSQNPDVDAQGACIGPRGMRVQNIGEELKNEKIDIVKWSDDPAEFIKGALSPSKVISVTVNADERSASVIVPDNQLSLAIGKAGQNVRLAARLTGWKLDIKSDKTVE